MAWLFNLAYLLAILLAFPWLLYSALRHGKYRQGWPEKLLGRVPRRISSRRCVWLHAVSVGEVNLLQTVLGRIEQEYADWDVVITTTTATGYALAKKRYAPRSVYYAPLDFSWAVKRFLDRIRPDVLLLAELELWPNLLRAARRRGVRVAVINGRLSEKSFRGYSRLKWLLRPTFASLDLVAAQNDEYAERFRALGACLDRVHVTGSLKFDGAQRTRANPATQRLARLAGIEPGDVVFLAGSTQSPEESLALDAFESLADAYPQLKLILVPRHPERFAEVSELLDRRGVVWQRRSALQECTHHAPRDDNPHAEREEYTRTSILLVDAVGELGAWWGTATIGFVGGSLGKRGGQNMIEPAAYGVAVSFGPNTWNFRDIVSQLRSEQAAEVVADGEELRQFVARCLGDPAYAQAMGRRAAQVVASQQGATARTIAALRPLMRDSGRERRRSVA